jgi:hypothetical protein
MDKEEEIKKINKALGEPFAKDFSDYIRKLRNNLIFVSFITIIMLLGEIELSDTSSFLGLKFSGLNNDLIMNVFTALIMYLGTHFGWCCLDLYKEHSLRLSGTKVEHVTTARLSSQYGDYPNDPRQSTLYNWWKKEASKISSLQKPLQNIETKLNEWEKKVETEKRGSPNELSVLTSISAVKSEIMAFTRTLDKVNSTISSLRIPVSLERFDKSFHFFIKSQGIRWIIIEILFPILLALFAMFLIVRDYYV